jgi:predicted dehydrogenase
MVGCNLRFHIGVSAVAQALREGRIGQPLSVRAHFGHYLPNWRPDTDYRLSYSAQKDQGGGILRDAIHEPDYLCWLFGRADEVMGWLCNLSDLEMDVEDTAVYFMRQGNVLSEVHVDFLRQDKSRGCEVVGTEGTLRWQSTGKNPENVSVRMFQAAKGKWESLHEEPAYDPNRQYVEEIAYFLTCVREEEHPMNGIEEAIHVLEILDGVRKSTLAGERVIIG